MQLRRGRSRLLLVALALASAASGVVLVALALYDRAAPRPSHWLADAHLEARFASVDGHRLRYVRSGSGPAIVLLHGFGASLYTWKDMIPALARDHDVVALDLPGFGQSDAPPDLVIEDLPRAVVGLLDQLGLGRAVLVGNSMGGAVAVLVAAEHAERADALVLVDAAGFRLGAGQLPRAVGLAMSPLAPLLARLPGRRLLVERALGQVFHDPGLVSKERVAEYFASARPAGFAAVRSLGRSLEHRSGIVREALSRVQAPTLVVWGREDAWIPLADAARFAAAVPGARAVTIEDCGHMPQEEQPQQLLHVVREFLAELRPAR